MNQNLPIPPPHKAEKVFREYEGHIHTILRNYPANTRFLPERVAATTFSARLRDAINSVIEYNWPTSVEVGRLEIIWRADLEIVLEGKEVIARRKGPHNKIVAAVGKELLAGDFFVEVDKPTKPILHSICLLLSGKHITKPAKLTNVDPVLLKEVTDLYDIGITTEGDVTIII